MEVLSLSNDLRELVERRVCKWAKDKAGALTSCVEDIAPLGANVSFPPMHDYYQENGQLKVRAWFDCPDFQLSRAGCSIEQIKAIRHAINVSHFAFSFLIPEAEPDPEYDGRVFRLRSTALADGARVASNMFREAVQALRSVDPVLAGEIWGVLAPLLIKATGQPPLFSALVRSVEVLLRNLREEAPCTTFEESANLSAALRALHNNMEWLKAWCSEAEDPLDPSPGGLVPDLEFPGGTDMLGDDRL